MAGGRLKPDHFFDENSYLVRVLAKEGAYQRAPGQLEQRCADRGGDGVQAGEDEYVAEAQCFLIVERIVAQQQLRQDVGTRILPMCRYGLDKIRRELDRGGEVGALEGVKQAQADDGVLPTDQPVSIFEGQAEQCQEDLRRIRNCQLSHGLALVLGCDRLDDLDCLRLQRRQHRAERVWAEERLQDLSETGVLRRIERQRDQRQWAAQYVECALRREGFWITQRATDILAASQVIRTVTENHRAGIA
jgi:hypothetical protein